MSHPLDLLALECLALVREAVGDGTDPAPEHPDARQIDAMLMDAMATGGTALLSLARDAVRRMTARGPAAVSWQTLFSESELVQLADVIAAVLAAADGLGRQLVRDMAGRVTESVTPTSQAPPPRRAVGYLQGLLPTPGTDPQRGGPDLRRQAFTLAAATNQQLLAAVQGEIGRRLQSGEAAGGTAAVQQILDAAGVSPANPQYAEMVFRTNAMDSYNQASQEELTATADVFPVWQYSNPHDSRSRPEHKARDGNYYPSSVPFTQVRGTDPADVCNCRCTFIPVTRRKWAKLRAEGKRIADGYADPLDQVQTPAPARQAPPKEPERYPGQLPLQADPGVTPRMVRDVEVALGVVSPEVNDLVARHGGAVRVVRSVIDAMPELAKERPRGWDASTSWDMVGGVYDPKSKQAVVGETYRPVGALGPPAPTTARRAGVARHEYGHMVDHAIGEQIGRQAQFAYERASLAPDFRSAYYADVDDLRQQKMHGGFLSYFLQKGEAGLEEAWAELFAVAHGGGAGAFDIRTFFPRSLAAVRQQLRALS